MSTEQTQPTGPSAPKAEGSTPPSHWALPLVRAAADGDRAKFDRLFDALFRMIYQRATSRTQNVEQAEKWTTTAFVAAIERLLAGR